MADKNKNDRQTKAKPEHNVLVHGHIQTHSSPEETKQHEAERKEDAATHKAEREEESAREAHKIWLERLGLLAVVIYAGITLWQGLLTRQAVKNAQDNFIKDQAPYIWVTPKPPKFEVNDVLRWDIQYTNYGRSPALNLRTCMTAAHGPQGLNFQIPFPKDSECANTAPPNARSSTVVPPQLIEYSSVLGDRLLTPEDINTINAVEGGAMVFGIITYEDSVGNIYETGFCSYRLRTGALMHCGQYNYIKQIK